jgi:hypothetical protein
VSVEITPAAAREIGANAQRAADGQDAPIARGQSMRDAPQTNQRADYYPKAQIAK